MPGNPHAEAATPIYASHQTHEQVVESLIYTRKEAILALAFEVRTVALLLAAGAGGNGVHDEDGLVEAAMRRMGMGETDDQ